ncbi:MAG: GNAT family N-acetyltransferase [Sedimentisphaerales bacterium]|nr:GNAT family N-acetyltransferase [Sedimentisphaerales bacterium]
MAVIPEQIHQIKDGSEVVIGNPDPDDAQALLDGTKVILKEDAFNVLTLEEFTKTVEEEKQWIQEHLDDSGKLLLAAKRAGLLAGLLGVAQYPQKRRRHVAMMHLSVQPDVRRLGIASALMQTAIDWATRHPELEKLTLAVFADNVPALGLYRKFRFWEEGRRPREIKRACGRYCDDILMYRNVTT